MPKSRERRQAELRASRLYDPVALLAIYKQGGDNLKELAERPGGVTYATIIAAILEREKRRRRWRSNLVAMNQPTT